MSDNLVANTEELVHSSEPHIATEDVPWLPLFLIPGAFFRVYNVDEESNVVLKSIKMPPWSTARKHGHYCKATGYTLEGEWFNDDLSFKEGELSWEVPPAVHQPLTRDKGATILITIVGKPGDDRLLEEHHEDGSKTLIRTRFFKALERISLEDFHKLDLESYLN